MALYTFSGWLAHQVLHELYLSYLNGSQRDPETGHEEYADLRKLRDDLLIMLAE